MDDKEKLELIKFNIIREDSLSNSRLTWLLTFQGFLFAAFAVFATSDNSELFSIFKNLFPLLGMISAATAFVVRIIGINCHRILHNMWIEIVPDIKLTPLGLQKKGVRYILPLFGLSIILSISCFGVWLFILLKV